jgi:ribosomal protein L35
MAKNSITDRFRVTKRGKVLRRPAGLGHSRANKTGKAIRDKRRTLGLEPAEAKKILKKYS